MTRTLEQLDAELSTANEVGRAALPSALTAAVDTLKVSRGLLGALLSIEQAAWESTLNTADGRASAFAISAWVYGDLSDEAYEALYIHIRERVTARRELLQEKFGSEQNTAQS